LVGVSCALSPSEEDTTWFLPHREGAIVYFPPPIEDGRGIFSCSSYPHCAVHEQALSRQHSLLQARRHVASFPPPCPLPYDYLFSLDYEVGKIPLSFYAIFRMAGPIPSLPFNSSKQRDKLSSPLSRETPQTNGVFPSG